MAHAADQTATDKDAAGEPHEKPDMMTPIRAVEKPCSLAVTASSVFNKPLPSCNSATLARIAPIGRIKVQTHTSLP